VVELEPDRFVAVCDGGYSDEIELTRSDVVLHRLDERLLRKALCAALDLRTSNSPVGTLPGAVQLGSHVVGQSLSVPVWLLGQEREHEVVAELERFRRTGSPVIALLWSDRMLTPEALAFDSPPLMVTTFDQVVVITADGFAGTEVWHVRLAAYRRAAKLAPQTSRHKKPTMAREGKTAGTPGKLKKAFKEWYLEAKPYLKRTGELRPRPSAAELGRKSGVSRSTASRWVTGKVPKPDEKLRLMWIEAIDPVRVRNFRG
jgi:hypothetical protein